LARLKPSEGSTMLKAKALRTASIYVPTKRRSTLDRGKVAELAESILDKGDNADQLRRADKKHARTPTDIPKQYEAFFIVDHDALGLC
jgi:hypothetical protein